MKKASVVAVTVAAILSVAVVVKVLAASVTGNAQIRPNLTHADTAGLSSPVESIGTIFTWAVTAGTGANQMDLLFIDQRTIAASTNETLDLAAGVTNSFGDVLTFARVKFLAIGGATANSGAVTVGGAAANAFTNWVDDATDQINVRPGGAVVFFAPAATGYPVTAGTGDQLLITNPNTNSVTYDIYIGGASS